MTIDDISKRCSTSGRTATLDGISKLVARGGLVERGARKRLVDVKPDVLRDRILLDWLTTDIGFGVSPLKASESGSQLVSELSKTLATNDVGPVDRKAILALAHTEMLLRLSEKPVDLLGPIFTDVARTLSETGVSQRLIIVDVLGKIAWYRPKDIVRVSRLLRENPAPTETITNRFSSRTYTHLEVVSKLGWLVGRASAGAKSEDEARLIFSELCELAEAEGGTGDLKNDGKRARDQIRSAISGGPQYWFAYDAVAFEKAGRLLAELKDEVPSSKRTGLLETLFSSVVSSDRHQTWADDGSFYMRRITIDENHSAYRLRDSLLLEIRRVLEDEDTPVGSRILLWKFAKSRSGQGPLENLQWATRTLSGRPRHVDELKAARKVWHWHLRFQNDPDIKAAAEVLEDIYISNDLAGEFSPLLSEEDWKQAGARAQEKAKELATRSVAEIVDFVFRAIRFFGPDGVRRISSVGWNLGKLAPARSTVREFIETALAAPRSDEHKEFALEAAYAWVWEPTRVHDLNDCGEIDSETTRSRGWPRPDSAGVRLAPASYRDSR